MSALGQKQTLALQKSLKPRQLFLGATRAAIIDQCPCATVKSHAVLTPNSSIPLTDSRAPINCQCRSSVSPDAPRVLIESMERARRLEASRARQAINTPLPKSRTLLRAPQPIADQSLRLYKSSSGSSATNRIRGFPQICTEISKVCSNPANARAPSEQLPHSPGLVLGKEGGGRECQHGRC